MSANGTGASKRYEHPEVQDLAAAVEVAFRGVKRDLAPMLPGAVVEVTASGAGDVAIGNPLHRTVSVCLPLVWRGFDCPAWHLKTNTDRQLVIHVAGPCDASFLVR